MTLRFRVVDLGERRVVVVDERRVGRRPVVAGVRRRRQAARGHLGEEVPGAPVVDRERALQVLVAPVGAAVEHDRVHRDARLGGHRRERLRHLRKTGRVVRCEQVDLEVRHAGLLEQCHGGRDVLITLGQVVAEVHRVERAVEVVGDAAVAAEHLIDHGLTIDHETHRLTDAHIGERFLIDRHDDGEPAAPGRVEHLVPIGPVEHVDRGRRDVAGAVDLVGDEGVDHRVAVGEVDDVHLVEVRLAGVPVVLVANVDRLHADLELLELVRPGADLVGGIAGEALVPVGNDAARVGAQVLFEVGHELLELDLHRALVDLGEARRVEDRSQGGATEHRQVGVDHAVERVDHVVGRDRPAVRNSTPSFRRTTYRSAALASTSSAIESVFTML